MKHKTRKLIDKYYAEYIKDPKEFTKNFMKPPFNCCSEYGFNNMTKLHIAAYCGMTGICKEILHRLSSAPAKIINKLDKDGLTPLDYAFANNQPSTLTFLIDQGGKLTENTSVRTIEELDAIKPVLLMKALEKPSFKQNLVNLEIIPSNMKIVEPEIETIQTKTRTTNAYEVIALTNSQETTNKEMRSELISVIPSEKLQENIENNIFSYDDELLEFLLKSIYDDKLEDYNNLSSTFDRDHNIKNSEIFYGELPSPMGNYIDFGL
ncbi:MAG: Ankyrin repeat (many copies) [Rickettsiaceae bacterium]|jgi:ankyrin repeat protein|nr:Ankyrin repeat (many copies) [Rickettsiaceae bacterium]